MSDNSWWQRNLGRFAPGAPAAPAGPASYPQKAVRWQESYPPTGSRQEVTEWNQPEGNGDSTYIRVRTQGYNERVPGNVGKVGNCPHCRGTNYFRRRWANTEAAPLCTDCGYNGDLWEQSGSLLNAIGMKSSGPTQFARSDNRHGEAHFEVHPDVPSDFSWSSVR